VTLHDAYKILGLSRDVTAVQVKAAYRRLVAEAHPDRGGEAAEFIRIRAAYEILTAFLKQGPPEDEIPIPADLRGVIDSIVRDFREHQRWAETETLTQLKTFETRMVTYIQSASRSELRQFSFTFRHSWDAIVGALFEKCNTRCDSILRDYESWYTESTQAVFDDLYRKELLHFAWRRRFWEIFLVLGAFAGALTVVIGWGEPVRRWVSISMIVGAAVLAFLAYRWRARRQRKTREKVEPLSVVPFEIQNGARFQTEATMRRGRRTTTAMGLAGMFLGNAASGGFAVPLVGAAAGAALGGVFDRLLNPTGQMRRSMQDDLHRFMNMARPQVTGYVLEAHDQLLDNVRGQIVANYQERVKGTVKLLTAGRSPARRARGDAAGAAASRST
jgi:hypothetical protein